MAKQISPLLSLQPAEKGKLVSFSGKRKVRNILSQYGIFEGDVMEVLRTAPFDGPVMLRINNREIAISKELAAFLQVETSH